MSILFALIMTINVNGDLFQTVPATFFTIEDCQAVIVENELDSNVFTCEVIDNE